jgi:hypothetical protein
LSEPLVLLPPADFAVEAVDSLAPESFEPESLEPESLEPESLEPVSLDEPDSFDPESLDELESFDPESALPPESFGPASLAPESLEPESLELDESDELDAPEPLADALDARESVLYQPLPLNTIPTGWMILRSVPPHCSHVVSGGSVKLCRFSTTSLQDVQV